MSPDETRASRFVNRLSISLAIVAGLLILCVIAWFVTIHIVTNKYGTLCCAAGNGDLFAMRCFVWKGVDVNAKDKSGETPLHCAASTGRADMPELLIAEGADVNAVNNSGWTPLHAAAGHAETAELLIAEGADVNAKDNEGKMPLQWAAWTGKTEMAELLIAMGANVNAKDTYGDTPRRKTTSDAIRRLLIEHGAVE